MGEERGITTNLFGAYLWLLKLLMSVRKLELKEIQEEWLHCEYADREAELSRRTFQHWREKVEGIFNVEIKCNGFNEYYIEERVQLGVVEQLLDSFSVYNVLNCASRNLQDRILFETLNVVGENLTKISSAMMKNRRVELRYNDYWSDWMVKYDVEPYCLKVFRKRWYLLGRVVSQLEVTAETVENDGDESGVKKTNENYDKYSRDFVFLEVVWCEFGCRRGV